MTIRQETFDFLGPCKNSSSYWTTCEIWNSGYPLVLRQRRIKRGDQWHGIRQMRTGWADGPEFITQCPIRPGGSYTYRFTIQGQEGTLWWHAHSSWLRATVYGALIIRPKVGDSYPFTKPKRETPLLLGEWWDANPIDVVRQATRTGAAPNVSDAYTINGQPGDLYNCSRRETVKVPVVAGETNLLRVINAALNQELFFTVANHKLTVVGADASYVKPFTTTVLMLGPGQTTDVLITADQPPARYYIAARAYASAQGAPFDNTTTTAILKYKTPSCKGKCASTKPVSATLPAFNDTATATAFASKFRSPRKVPVPTDIDDSLFVTVGLGLNNCPKGAKAKSCQGPNGTRFTASMNNASFVLPSNFSLLQAHHQRIPGVFTTDFPAAPPRKFDYTGNVSRSLWQPARGTKVYKLKYGARVQVVLQGTSIFTAENHPIHLHGYDFYIIAEGFGNFNPKTDTAKFNLVDPPLRNTASVPVKGWSVIRFVAENPGVWLMHCHLDVHIGWGLAMAFIVENGMGELETLEHPPADLPERKEDLNSYTLPVQGKFLRALQQTGLTGPVIVCLKLQLMSCSSAPRWCSVHVTASEFSSRGKLSWRGDIKAFELLFVLKITTEACSGTSDLMKQALMGVDHSDRLVVAPTALELNQVFATDLTIVLKQNLICQPENNSLCSSSSQCYKRISPFHNLQHYNLSNISTKNNHKMVNFNSMGNTLHGIRQMRTGWADGPEFITQCPIRPGHSYTYRFTIQGQEGTLWWHAHSSWLRATVYGALIIRPKAGDSYPFTKPKRETPLLLGEWWDGNPIDVVRQATRTGAAPNVSDAYTINGQPGDLYNCSSKGTVKVPVVPGETNLLRVINSALNQELFFTVANHKLTVVGADASYVKPFSTSVLMLGPGQTTDVLITANQPPARYYIAARAYASAQGAPFDNTTTTAILEYKTASCTGKCASTKPVSASLPAFNDTATATAFTKKFRSPKKVPVPTDIDESLFITVGLGLNNCPKGARARNCQGPNGTRFTASMNNASFVLPSNFSLLQAHQQGIPGVFTTDFPAAPPVKFDYTGNVSRSLWQPARGTKVYKLKYGARVQVVLQGTSIFTAENHPIHLHGYDFYIIAEGFGNFNPKTDTAKFNLVDPPLRNTASVPVKGWSVIRFVADNPGVWLMHCHLDVHIGWGLATAFIVENGVGELETVEHPPADLPVC
ncbi:hypothetical protein LguiA_034800 [Lonicera macranthoides]